MDISKILTSERSLLVLTLISLSVFFLTLYQRWITLDDAWFAEQAYWFLKDHYVRSDLFEGLKIYEGQHLVYHKLHVWLGSFVIWIAGFDAYALKSISIVMLVIFNILIFSYLKNQSIHSYKKTYLTFTFLFFTNTIVVLHGFEYRPDIAIMCTGFVTYLFLRKAILNDVLTPVFFAGFMTGITMLLHLNGLIFVLSGITLLLLEKMKFRFIIVFCLGVLVSFSVYFFELTSLEKVDEYIYELTNSPAVKEQDKNLWGILLKILYEPKRYMHHSFEFFYLCLLIISITLNWKKIKANPELKRLLVFFSALTLFMSMIVTGSKTVYLLYTLPYLLLLVAMLLPDTLEQKKYHTLVIVILSLYFVTNIARNYTIFERRNGHIIEQHSKIAQKYNIQKQHQILAPMTFVFNELLTTKIQGFLPYVLKYEKDLEKLTPELLFTDINKRGKDFALLNEKMLQMLKLVPEQGTLYHGYRYLGKESYLYIFKRENDI